MLKKLVSNILFYPVSENRLNYSRQLYFKQISKDFNNCFFNLKNKKVLSISGSDELSENLGFDRTNITDLQFPDYDCTDLNTVHSESSDVYVSDQVLEHIGICPRKKFIEVNRVIKRGGIIVIATCFYNKLHMLPHDYMRYTEAALMELCKEQNWKVVKTGSFGTAGLAVVNVLGGSGKGFRFPPKLLVKIIDKLIGESKYKYPLYTYVFAEKSS